MNKYFLLICLVCGHAGHAIASDQPIEVRWERDAAQAIIDTNHVNATASKIGDISTLADSQATLEKLAELENRDDWPWPVREATLYRFTRSLASLPRDAVATEVMRYLRDYKPRTLVPHEERDDVYVPLFNIRAAADGIENGWQRAEAARQATMALQNNPVTLVDMFTRSEGVPQRQGYLDAMNMAGPAEVVAVLDTALARLEQISSLTPLVAATALLMGDTSAMQELLVNGQGAGLATAYRKFAQHLGQNELAGLLEFSVYQAPPANASLAIAAWWPLLRHDPGTRELMLGLLENPRLGSSAALALSWAPDIQTIKQLQEIATGDSSAARHAQMALGLERARFSGADPR